MSCLSLEADKIIAIVELIESFILPLKMEPGAGVGHARVGLAVPDRPPDRLRAKDRPGVPHQLPALSAASESLSSVEFETFDEA